PLYGGAGLRARRSAKAARSRVAGWAAVTAAGGDIGVAGDIRLVPPSLAAEVVEAVSAAATAARAVKGSAVWCAHVWSQTGMNGRYIVRRGQAPTRSTATLAEHSQFRNATPISYGPLIFPPHTAAAQGPPCSPPAPPRSGTRSDAADPARRAGAAR